jgi:uncharacterized membrane protein
MGLCIHCVILLTDDHLFTQITAGRYVNMKLNKYDQKQIKQASAIALWSLLNLTFLPLLSFIVLLSKINQFASDSFSAYHLNFAIKLNLAAATALILVSALMILFGGFNSGMTWVFVITYFISVHAFFILIAVWMLVRAWAGNKMGYKQV